MSDQLRIRVLRLRQLSATRRLYRAHERVDPQAAPGVGELAVGALEVTLLQPVPRRGEVAKAARLTVVQPLERSCGGGELPPLEVPLGTPDRALAPCLRGRPLLLRTRVVGHGDDRA